MAEQDIQYFTQLMETHAKALKAQLPPEQQSIIDAIVMVEKLKTNPTQKTVSELRGMAIRFFPNGSACIASCMELIAKHLDEIEITRTLN